MEITENSLIKESPPVNPKEWFARSTGGVIKKRPVRIPVLTKPNAKLN